MFSGLPGPVSAAIKKWVKDKEKKISSWFICINNFDEEVKTEFAFTFYFMSLRPLQLEYSTLKSFILGRIFANFQTGKQK